MKMTASCYSTKQTRRLAGESGKGGILGSELSTEDFDFNHEQGAVNTVKKELEIKGKKYVLIESDVNNTSSNYSKILSFVSSTEFLPIKSECYDKQGKLLKTIDFLEYKKLAGNKWRASQIKIRNVQNKRGTDIELSDIKLNRNLKPSKFTAKSLAED
jgi:outer membrane lipoprotein-sorting protein